MISWLVKDIKDYELLGIKNCETKFYLIKTFIYFLAANISKISLKANENNFVNF